MATALFLALFSCSKEAWEQPPVYEYRFTLDEECTKASLNEDGVFWESGDKVGLFLGDGTSVQATVDASTSPKTIVFSSGSPLEDGTEVRAYYPYVAGNSSVTAAKISFSSAQKGGSKSAMPLAGVPFTIQDNGNKGVVHFLNLGAVVDFRVFSAAYRETVQSISLKVSDGAHAVSGDATLDLTAVTPANEPALAVGWKSTATNPSSITLTQRAEVATSKEAFSGHLYMVLAPGTYSGSIVVKTDAATYTIPFQNLSFQRNVRRRINLNLGSANVWREGTYSLENDSVAGYLDAVAKRPYDPADYSYTHVKTYCGGNTSQTNRLDWPRPVTINWTNPSSGNTAKVVSVYNNAAMTQLELSVTETSVSATCTDVYNLVPGRKYYYRVTNGDQTISSGAFTTTGRRRMIKVGDSPYGMGYANNCRDFGGQKTTSGKTIRYGKIYRGSNLDLTTQEGRNCLLNYMKVELDVDLRSTDNSDTPGSGASYIYDALGFGDMHTTQEYNSWANLTDVSRMSATLHQIFSAVAQDKVPYIHCKVGADRTGYVCMLLEAILGVAQGDCDVDYELSSFSGAVDDGKPRTRTGENNYYYLTKQSWWGTTVQGVDFINTFEGDTFQDKAINYLTGTLEISMDEITTFQNKMLER